jgi:serine/threonine-protein kinase
MAGIGSGTSWVVPGFAQERELGRGASGRVVAAVHMASGYRVAIKYLSSAYFGDPEFLSRFRAEAAVLRSLADPHVVRLFDYMEAPGQGAAIVMELVSGVSLHQMITRQGPTAPESALAVLKGSLLGLAAAHALGIVHRDYKPENVLVDGAGLSKLTDFGFAARAGDAASFGGTPQYMAPEQWDGSAPSPATDIYAATAVFFECLTGTTPFSGGVVRRCSRAWPRARPRCRARDTWPLTPRRSSASSPVAPGYAPAPASSRPLTTLGATG